MLAKAIVIATNAHEGQLDKAGNPYILHPLRIMLRVSYDALKQTASDSSCRTEKLSRFEPDEALEIIRVAAVLHDVVEDTSVTLAVLRREGFSNAVIDTVDLLTRRKAAGQTYAQFVVRIRDSGNPFSHYLKLEDIGDNTTPSRMAVLPHDVRKGLKERYARAKRLLLHPVG